MSKGTPEHGEIVVVKFPAQRAYTQRRQWCSICGVWKWENALGRFMHVRRSWQCRIAPAPVAAPRPPESRG